MGKIKKKGFKSFSTTLVMFALMMLAIAVVCVGATGIVFLFQSMKEAQVNFETASYDGYRTEIKSEVQSALAIVESYYNQSQDGSLTEDEAKTLALETIRSMRYRDDDSGYMWVDDTDYILLMHPILPEQEGNNRYELQDQNGVMIIQSIMKSAQAGGGYNEFYFTKADGVTVAPKLAYSEMFEPWGWVITTGNYVDDMQAALEEKDADIQDTFKGMLILFVAVGVIIVLGGMVLAWLFGSRITKEIKKLEVSLRQVADGNLNFASDGKLLTRADEIGKIADSVEVVKNSLSKIIAGLKDSSGELQADSKEFERKFEEITENIKNINTAVEELAQGATDQAAETETVNNKIIELGKVIETEKKDVSGLGMSVAEMMSYSDKAIKSIEELSQSSETLIEGIGIMYEQTQENSAVAVDINKAVETIKSITEQTNLLSLNASIEASRAGEAGRGFAVVAEEIRNLSDESAKSAKEIEIIVQNLSTSIKSSGEKMNTVSGEVGEQKRQLEATKKSFTHLYEEIKKVEDVAKEIDNQTDVLDGLKTSVSEAATNLASVVEENAAMTQETSASMQVLSDVIASCRKDTQRLVELSDEQTEDTRKFHL